MTARMGLGHGSSTAPFGPDQADGRRWLARRRRRSGGLHGRVFGRRDGIWSWSSMETATSAGRRGAVTASSGGQCLLFPPSILQRPLRPLRHPPRLSGRPPANYLVPPPSPPLSVDQAPFRWTIPPPLSGPPAPVSAAPAPPFAAAPTLPPRRPPILRSSHPSGSSRSADGLPPSGRRSPLLGVLGRSRHSHPPGDLRPRGDGNSRCLGKRTRMARPSQRRPQQRRQTELGAVAWR
ncbi:putative vegetative cell wall protein gp1-like isoform X5 [Iris pallida]|uniref:Vegetative cell wall protein gp1-like isoform X5 n=1 Tax=Iris pallida TaxID=29817 RepID=A0AAX6G2R5_IRIPA|nr:putative vegetative cell wall protein gp1-like isoform X5 [Iris pallida]